MYVTGPEIYKFLLNKQGKVLERQQVECVKCGYSKSIIYFLHAEIKLCWLD